ncbi:MAG TPA: cytochrome c, partial [Chryseolinea sp.]|nr:cytochrome c [Chryseolinea sp.]
MRKIILITSTIGFASLYFTNCNSGNSSDSSAISTDSITIAHGKASFENKCASCHNFSGNGIGPQLAGITLQQPIEWIKGFIKNPKKVIDAGDTTAQKLFKEYKAAMPSFDYLSNEEIDALIAFIGTQKKLERKFVPVDTNDIKNPIADAVESSGLMVDIALVTQIPPSSSDTPVTRITKLDYQPNNGNLYVIDLRGKLYKLQNGQPSVYMDIAALRSKFINQPGTATGFGSFAFHPEFSKNGL